MTAQGIQEARTARLFILVTVPVVVDSLGQILPPTLAHQSFQSLFKLDPSVSASTPAHHGNGSVTGWCGGACTSGTQYHHWIRGQYVQMKESGVVL